MASSWERLETESSSSASTITTSAFTPKKHLKIIVECTGGSSSNLEMQFGTGGSIVASGYTQRRTKQYPNSSDTTNTGQSRLRIGDASYSLTDFYFVANIINIDGYEKQVIGHGINNNTGNDQVPASYELAGKWTTTSGQIDIIKVGSINDGATLTGLKITVYGADDQTITAKDKSTITNVPAGTRYEETDTRKIFRRKIGVATTHNGFDLTGTSNDGGDCWTNEPIRGQKILAGNNLIGKTITTATFRVKSHNANLEGDLTLGVWNSSGVLQHTFWRGRGKDHITTSESNITGNAEKVTWWTGNNEARNIGNNGGRLGLGVKISTGHYLIGKTINKFTVRLKIDTGSPTGNMTAHIRRNGSSDIDSTTTLDASTVTSSNADYSFSFPDTVIANGDIITIEYASGSSANINLRTCESIGTSPYDTVSNETGMKATSTPSTYSNWVTEASGGETGSLCYHATQVGSGGHTIAEGDIIGFASNASTSHRLSVRSYKYSNAGVSIANEEEGEYDGGWTPADGGIRDLQYSVVYLEDLWVEKGTA